MLENDNLHGEFLPLLPDMPSEIPWARIALRQQPDAVNLWIGNSKSTTSLHKDNYENIFCQLVGQKHFTLIPPIEAPCVSETMVPQATYQVGLVAVYKLLKPILLTDNDE